MRIAVVGLGLIGGSMAIDLRKTGFAHALVGVDANSQHAEEAVNLQIVDEILPLDEAVSQCDIIILATPVSQLNHLLPQVLDLVDEQIVVDVGSTKSRLLEVVRHHPKRQNYIATHPMAGTEFSGPSAAIEDLFQNKVAIVCGVENSDAPKVLVVTEMYEHLGMAVVQMDSEEHDVHAAYVSHISHISSFALALTVLEKEKNSNNIFLMASGGFDSTVRLAKSSHQMWTPVFTQNSENVISVLDTYIKELVKFRNAIADQDEQTLDELILQANDIKKILK